MLSTVHCFQLKEPLGDRGDLLHILRGLMQCRDVEIRVDLLLRVMGT